MIRSLTAALRSRVRRWARRRQGSDPNPLTLERRRIYILPTRQGIAFGLMLFVMLLGSMNYNNSLGLAASFGLAGFALVAMHHCHRALVGLKVRFCGADPVFAGQPARYQILLENESRYGRQDLSVSHRGNLCAALDLAPGQRARVAIPVATDKRGALRLDRFRLASRYPGGLFEAWTWVHNDMTAVVYPAPAREDSPPPPRRQTSGGAQHDARGDEDFVGLRGFRAGDSPRHIAWKAMARDDEPRIKQFAGTDVTSYWFELARTPGADIEARLSLLARWIVDANRHGHAFGLTMPDTTFETNVGPAHLQRCLTGLALF